MGNEPTYLGVMSGLIRLFPALNANAADRTHPEGPRLRLAKIAMDVEGNARQQAAVTAELNLQPFHGLKPRTSQSSTPSEPTAPVPTPAPPAAQ
jgi:hypothetical protein